MSSLVRVCWDPRGQVRGKAIDAFFSLLQTHGANWDNELWQMVFSRMLFKELFGGIFANWKKTYECMDGVRCDRKDWLQTSCEAAMCALVDTLAMHRKMLLPFFEQILEFLGSLILQDATDPSISVCGVAIRTLRYIVSVGLTIDEAYCSPFLSSIQRLFNQTAPTQFVAQAVAAAAHEQEQQQKEEDAEAIDSQVILSFLLLMLVDLKCCAGRAGRYSAKWRGPSS